MNWTIIRCIFLLFTSTLLTSCATILNSPERKVLVHTSKQSSLVIFEGDTIKTYDFQAYIFPKRSKDSITVTSVSDTVTSVVKIKSKNSLAYYSNIVFNYGIGMLIESKNPKRYTYPKDIFFGDESQIIRKNSFLPKKGSVFLHLSLPYVNAFELQPENEPKKSNIGFWGISAGLDYYHQRDQFLNLTVGSVTDIFVPVPAPVSYGSEYEIMFSRFVAASNNHLINKFSLGYGLSFNSNIWERHFNPIDEDASPTDVERKIRNSLGLMMSAYYRMGKRFNIGVTFRPSFISVDNTDSRCEHVISLDLAWKIKL